MIIAIRSDPGYERKINEDSIIFSDGPYSLFGVADGMGYPAGGSTASGHLCQQLKEELKNSVPDSETLRKAIQKANEFIYSMQLDDQSLSGMGTTLTILWRRDQKMLIGHVGDSRAYLYRNQKLIRITTDHSVVQEFIERGILTADQARTHPLRNMITRAVGTDPVVQADITEMDIFPGDRYLVCSDGLTEYLNDEEIRTVFLTDDTVAGIADALLQQVTWKLGKDNISIIVAEVEHV